MNHFDYAFDELMIEEGGGRFHEVKGDAGGATNYGVSLRFLKGLDLADGDIDRDGDIDADDIREMTESHAKAICLRHFWLRYRLNEIEPRLVAAKLLSIYYNMRPKTAGLVAQRALRACGVRVVEDGIIGRQTLDAINDLCESDCGLEQYLVALRSEQNSEYRVIVASNPGQAKFAAGWANRAYRIPS